MQHRIAAAAVVADAVDGEADVGVAGVDVDMQAVDLWGLTERY